MRSLGAAVLRRCTLRVVRVSLLLILLLFLDASAVSPTLHSLVCPKAGQPDDDCAVACFAAGLVESPPVTDVSVTVIECHWIAVQWCDKAFPTSPLFRLSPSRAPPV